MRAFAGLAMGWVVVVTWLPAAAELPDPLTLEQALLLADSAHPLLAQADARLAEAAAEQARVAAIGSTKVDLELAARLIEPSFRAKPVEPSNNDSWAKLRIHKQLYDFGRNGYLEEAARAELRGRQFDLLEARQQRRLQVMRDYFQVLLADLEQARDNEAMASAYVRLDRARSRNQLGQLSDIDLLQLESRYQQLLHQQRASQARQRASRSQLALSLNHPQQLPSNVEFPALTALQRAPVEMNDLLQRVLADNPQLQALRKDMQAARQRMEAARAGDGAVLEGFIEGAAYQRSMGGSDPFSAALVLNIPLSSGGAIDAEVARNRARMQHAQALLAAKELELRQAVLEVWLELETLKARRNELTALGEFRDLAFDRSRALYEMEFSSDLGDAMTEISEVKLLQAEANFNTVLAWARLDALAGRLIGGAGEAWRDMPESNP